MSDLPKEWTWTTLGDVTFLNPRITNKPAKDEPVSFVPMGELIAESARTSTGTTRPFYEVAKGYRIFRNSDLLVAKITPCFQNNKIGQAVIDHPVGVGSTEFHVIRPIDDKVDARFLLHFLRQDWIRREGERKMTGSGGQRRLPHQFLSSLKLPLPPLEEQRRIATILDQAEQLEERYADIDKLFTRLQATVTRQAVRRASKRVKLSELLDRIESGKSPVCEDRPGQDDEWAVLKLGAISSGVFDHHQNKALRSETVPNANYEVRAGDVLFSRKNTKDLVGVCTLVHKTRARRLLPDLIFRLVPRDDAPLLKPYLVGALSAPEVRNRLVGLAGGSAASMVNISKSKLMNFEVPLADTATQELLARQLSAIDTARITYMRAAHRAKSLTDSLQSRAFRGNL